MRGENGFRRTKTSAGQHNRGGITQTCLLSFAGRLDRADARRPTECVAVQCVSALRCRSGCAARHHRCVCAVEFSSQTRRVIRWATALSQAVCTSRTRIRAAPFPDARPASTASFPARRASGTERATAQAAGNRSASPRSADHRSSTPRIDSPAMAFTRTWTAARTALALRRKPGRRLSRWCADQCRQQ